MRLIFALAAMLFLAQCATRDDNRFQVGQSARAFVIIGVAKAEANTIPRYSMLWRRLDHEGRFLDYEGDTSLHVDTNESRSVRVRAVPGEFILAEVEPGVYALDSVFALIRERRVDYSANGVITGPDRPSFEVRAGEAVYLGIWQVDLSDVTATARSWRLERADLDAVLRRANPVLGDVTLREAETRAVTCAPHRLNTRSQRQVC